VGTPVLEEALVRAEVLEQFKDEKVLVFKKKRRKQFRRTRGHRQQLTRIRVEGIYPDRSLAPAEEAPEAKPAPAPTPAPKAAPKAPAQAEAPAKKAAAKPKKPAKKAAQEPQARTVGKKTAGAKPAAKPKRTSKE
jgi:large subunit ribosomal protein L21